MTRVALGNDKLTALTATTPHLTRISDSSGQYRSTWPEDGR